MRILNMIKLFNLGSILTIILISTTALTATPPLPLLADTIMSPRSAGTMNAYGQTGSMATLKYRTQYAVSIVPDPEHLFLSFAQIR